MIHENGTSLLITARRLNLLTNAKIRAVEQYCILFENEGVNQSFEGDISTLIDRTRSMRPTKNLDDEEVKQEDGNDFGQGTTGDNIDN